MKSAAGSTVRYGVPIAAAGLAIGFAGKQIGEGFRDFGKGAGEGAGAFFEHTLSGAGRGTEQAGEGLGAGLKSLILPILVIGGLVIASKAVK